LGLPIEVGIAPTIPASNLLLLLSLIVKSYKFTIVHLLSKKNFTMTPTTTKISAASPQLGQGIYLIKDVSKILQLPYEKVYRWIVGYWGNSLSEDFSYVFGTNDNRAINFYSLIEFYTFVKLREKGVTTHDIKLLHKQLSVDLNTPYPFAMAQDYFVDRKHKRKVFIYYKYFGSLIRLDKRKQFSFDFIIK